MTFARPLYFISNSCPLWQQSAYTVYLHISWALFEQVHSCLLHKYTVNIPRLRGWSPLTFFLLGSKEVRDAPHYVLFTRIRGVLNKTFMYLLYCSYLIFLDSTFKPFRSWQSLSTVILCKHNSLRFYFSFKKASYTAKPPDWNPTIFFTICYFTGYTIGENVLKPAYIKIQGYGIISQNY